MDSAILAMAVTTATIFIITKYIKRDTGIKQVDHFINYIRSQATNIPYAAIFVALMFVMTEELSDRFELFQ